MFPLPKTSCLLLALVLALAACATPQPPVAVIKPAPVPVCPPAPPAPQIPADLVVLKSLLNYQYQLRLLSPADLTHELASLNEQIAPGPELALRKALVLSLGHTTAELTLAQAQLDAVMSSADTQAEALKPLASLLGTRIVEQRRLLDSADKLNLQLRESQRRGDQLTDKLEALKAIEHTLPVTSLPATAASANGR
ncbi:MAG TPA: hypothetical protein VGM81_11410 [Burkholderiaceae bacterium]|jgi:hypothetical protein